MRLRSAGQRPKVASLGIGYGRRPRASDPRLRSAEPIRQGNFGYARRHLIGPPFGDRFQQASPPAAVHHGEALRAPRAGVWADANAGQYGVIGGRLLRPVGAWNWLFRAENGATCRFRPTLAPHDNTGTACSAATRQGIEPGNQSLAGPQRGVATPPLAAGATRRNWGALAT